MTRVEDTVADQSVTTNQDGHMQPRVQPLPSVDRFEPVRAVSQPRAPALPAPETPSSTSSVPVGESLAVSDSALDADKASQIWHVIGTSSATHRLFSADTLRQACERAAPRAMLLLPQSGFYEYLCELADEPLWQAFNKAVQRCDAQLETICQEMIEPIKWAKKRQANNLHDAWVAIVRERLWSRALGRSPGGQNAPGPVDSPRRFSARHCETSSVPAPHHADTAVSDALAPNRFHTHLLRHEYTDALAIWERAHGHERKRLLPILTHAERASVLHSEMRPPSDADVSALCALTLRMVNPSQSDAWEREAPSHFLLRAVLDNDLGVIDRIVARADPDGALCWELWCTQVILAKDLKGRRFLTLVERARGLISAAHIDDFRAQQIVAVYQNICDGLQHLDFYRVNHMFENWYCFTDDVLARLEKFAVPGSDPEDATKSKTSLAT